MIKIYKGTFLIGLCFIALLLVSCKSFTLRPTRGRPAIEDMHTTMRDALATDKKIAHRSPTKVPKNVENALLPAMTGSSTDKQHHNEERFNVSVKDEPAKTFFMGLVKGTDYNIIVSPKVTGTISLNLKNVTIPEVLAAVRDAYGYNYERTSYGFRIYPPGLETKFFTINYLDIVRNGQSNTVISAGGITGRSSSGITSTSSSGTTTSTTSSQDLTSASLVETKTKSDFWKTLKDTLGSIIGEGEGRKVVIEPDSGTVMVKASPGEVKEVGKYLDAIQHTMQRQVIIDAKVLEVTLNKDYQAGIDWSILQGFTTSSTGDFKRNGGEFLKSISDAMGNPFVTLKTKAGDFISTIKALSTQGNVQVLSSPRIATMNNQKAVIKVGGDEFFVTDVSSTSVGVSNTAETSQDIELTPFFSGIALDVTPEISPDGDVTLHIHPLVSRVEDESKTFEVNDKTQNLPLALSTIREADSVVHAQNNQIVIIGGLMENKTEEKTAGVPFLDRLPFLGAAFRRTEQESVKTELVILLRPTVVVDNSWRKKLKIISDRFKSLDEGYHFGPYPDVYGNLGETDEIRG